MLSTPGIRTKKIVFRDGGGNEKEITFDSVGSESKLDKSGGEMSGNLKIQGNLEVQGSAEFKSGVVTPEVACSGDLMGNTVQVGTVIANTVEGLSNLEVKNNLMGSGCLLEDTGHIQITGNSWGFPCIGFTHTQANGISTSISDYALITGDTQVGWSMKNRQGNKDQLGVDQNGRLYYHWGPQTSAMENITPTFSVTSTGEMRCKSGTVDGALVVNDTSLFAQVEVSGDLYTTNLQVLGTDFRFNDGTGNLVDLVTTLAAKEPTISEGETSEYFRGDKTWQTLSTDNVLEGENNKYSPFSVYGSASYEKIQNIDDKFGFHYTKWNDSDNAGIELLADNDMSKPVFVVKTTDMNDNNAASANSLVVRHQKVGVNMYPFQEPSSTLDVNGSLKASSISALDLAEGKLLVSGPSGKVAVSALSKSTLENFPWSEITTTTTGSAYDTLNVGQSGMAGKTYVNLSCTNGGVINIGSQIGGNSSAGTTINIGTGLGANTINIGASGDTINLAGDTNIIKTTNLEVHDNIITLNKGSSGSSTARLSGIQIRDNNNDASGFIRTAALGNQFELKAPESSFTLSTPILTKNEVVATVSNLDTYETTLSFGSPLVRAGSLITMPAATSSNNGFLSSAMFNAFNGKQASITGAATTITTANLTANRALVSDANGKVGTSTVSSTTLGYLDATSSVQNQLNNKEGTISTGTTTQYWRGDKTWQTLNTNAVVEGSNLYFTQARARGSLSAGTGISYNSATGVISSLLAESQWTTSGPHVTYSTGNVGIGIAAAPSAKLHINHTGTGACLLVEDATNPDTTPFIIDEFGTVGVNISTAPVSASLTSKIYLNGDFSFHGHNKSIMFNSYYDNGWKYAAGTVQSPQFAAHIKLDPLGSFIINSSSTAGVAGAAQPGADRLVILLNGNVGIGTSSPTSKLDINGSIRTAGNSDIPSEVNSNAIFSGGYASPVIGRCFMGDGTGWRYHFSNRTANTTTDLFTFRDIGNFGINNTSPESSIDISRDTRAGTHPTGLALYATRTASNNTQSIAEIRRSDGTQGIGFGWNSINASGTNTDQDLEIRSKGNGEVRIYTNGAERLKVDSAGNVSVSGKIREKGNDLMPVGAIIMWYGSSPPAGWAICDGTIQNGVQTPDLRGTFVLGSTNSNAGGTTIPDANYKGGTNLSVGLYGGERNHTLNMNEMPAHSHSVSSNATRWFQGTTPLWFQNTTGLYDFGYNNVNYDVGNAGGSQPHNNMPPYYVLTYIMKVT